MSVDKTNIGATSLTIAILGMLFFYILTFYIEDSILINMLLAGFEAAVVGGIADWFAVTALFKEIPIPFVKKHTNIIVKSRVKLTKGIVHLVSEQWLSKESILFRINKLLSICFIEEQLKSKKNQQLLVNTINKGFAYSLKNRDTQQLEITTQKVIVNLLETSKITNFISDVGLTLLEENKQEKPLIFILNKLEKALESEVVLVELEQVVSRQIKEYINKKSSFTKLFVEVTQSVGGLDNKTAALKIQNGLCSFIKELKENRNHPVRLEIDKELIALVSTKEGKSKINEFLEVHLITLLKRLINEKSISFLLKEFSASITNKESKFNKGLLLVVTDQLHKLANNKEQLHRIKNFAMDALFKMISNKHRLIAQTVSDNLNKLNNQALVSQIEDNVGDQLQYIRLNGAIIGGTVGCLLFLLKQIFH